MNRNVESHFSLIPRANIQRSIFDRSSSHKTSFNAGRLIPFYIDEVLPGDTFDITTSKIIRSQTLLAPIMDDIYLDTFWFFVPNRLVWSNWEEFCGENKQGPWAVQVEHNVPRINSPADGFKPGSLADYFGLPVAGVIHNSDGSTTPFVPRWNASRARTLDASAADSSDSRNSGNNILACPSALPFRAYALICNHFFRDENLSSPLYVPLDDADIDGIDPNDDSTDGNYLMQPVRGGAPYKPSKYHDYFTSCLPSPQKGSAVGVPVDLPQFLPVTTNYYQFIHNGAGALNKLAFNTTSANVMPLVFGTMDYYKYGDTNTSAASLAAQNIYFGEDSYLSNPPGFDQPSGHTASGVDNVPVAPIVTRSNGSSSSAGDFELGAIPAPVSGADLKTFSASSGTGGEIKKGLFPLNLYAETTGKDSFFTVNQFRLAVALQTFLEALARGGSRYGEMIAQIFGVQNPDARLQHPEYLGGNRVPLNVSQVSNTAQSSDNALGDVGAQSVTSDVHSDFIKSFTEHGFLIGLCCVRYEHSYSQGLERFWTRGSFTDYYNPLFANLGETPVYTSELYYAPGAQTGSSNDKLSYKHGVPVFGYQEIWADYRYKPNRVSGEMRPQHPQSLDYWHLSDFYSSNPLLSDTWIREDSTNLDRCLAVSSKISNQFWADFYVKCKCTRPMPMYSIPALEPRF